MSRKINILACGGFGQNIMMAMVQRKFFPLLADDIKLFALDTSSANLRKYEEAELTELVSVHLVPKADGSGAFRGENNEAITTMVGELVNSGKIPEGICIVISSASGGSGAMIAGDLIQMLSDRGRSVFGMFLETDEDDQRVNNTLKTVKTLRHKAAQGTAHYSVFWQNNRNDEGRTQKAHANAIFLESLENFIAIGHPMMDILDTKDIHHFLQYPIKTNNPGEVRFISVRQRTDGELFEESNDVPLSILSLLTRNDLDSDFPRGVGYTTYGVLPKGLDFTDDRVETQFLISAGKVAKLANHLESTIKEYEKIRQEQEAAQAGNQIRTSDKDVVSDTGSFL